MTTNQIITCLVVAFLGHIMALIWVVAANNEWKICRRTIYNMPISYRQIIREIKNSWHAPFHGVVLAAVLYLGFFNGTTFASFFYTLVLCSVWAEVWHYGSHRAFHLPALHWIHAEHHKSHINSPLSAISFSFLEKAIFDVGIILPFLLLEIYLSINFYGIAAWYMILPH